MPSTEPLPPQAQPQPQQRPVPSYQQYQRRHKKSQWYGWQTLIVDGGWIVGGPLVSAASPGTGAGIILGGYFLGGPIVHWAHGQVGRGFADLGIRVGAPTLLGALGYFALSSGGSRGGDNLAGIAGAVIGATLGGIAAIVIDASVLAYEPADDDDDDGRLHKTPRRNALLPTSIAPMAAPRTEGGFVFGLSGTLY